MPAPTSSPRPQARPDTTSTNSQGTTSHSDGPNLPASASSPPPSRPSHPPANAGNDNSAADVTSLGAPELQQPKVRDALRKADGDEGFIDSAKAVIANALVGDPDLVDPIVDTLPLEERVDLAFDQRIEAGILSTMTGMAAADTVGAVKNLFPPALKFPAQVVMGTTVSRVTMPPIKDAADWYHHEVLGQPIVDPAPSIFSEENLADFVPGVVSTTAAIGAQGMTTAALTALGVTNPAVLVVAGVGAGVYASGKAWVMTDEIIIPAITGYVSDALTQGVDIEALTGVRESDLSGEYNPPSIEELEALWDSVADQISAAEAEALRPSVGVLAPDSWTIGDIARYEVTGEMPEVDEELAELFLRTGLSPVGIEQPELAEVSSEEVVMFRTTRAPDSLVAIEGDTTPLVDTVTFIDYVPPEPIDVFVSNDDGPDSDCLVPFWLIPYVAQLAAYGVRDFCALQGLTPADIEELLDELSNLPEELGAESEDEQDILVVFTSSRVDKVEVGEDDDDEDHIFSLLG